MPPDERLSSYPHQFSGGMRQRVAIAIAFLNEPDLIVADEPTTALDVTIQGQILHEAQTLRRETGTAMIWITHDLAVVAGLRSEEHTSELQSLMPISYAVFCLNKYNSTTTVHPQTSTTTSSML